MIKVSVIVAVYNTAPYLRQCLDSLMRQSLRDIEVLCVDDGSSDSSPPYFERMPSVMHESNPPS